MVRLGGDPGASAVEEPGDGVEEVAALLREGGQVAAHVEEALGAEYGAPASGDLLLDLG